MGRRKGKLKKGKERVSFIMRKGAIVSTRDWFVAAYHITPAPEVVAENRVAPLKVETIVPVLYRDEKGTLRAFITLDVPVAE